MELVTLEQTEYRHAKAWYVQYPLDAYALGPYRYNEFVPASQVVEDAEEQFGEKPKEVWPDGETVEAVRIGHDGRTTLCLSTQVLDQFVTFHIAMLISE